MNNLLSDIRYLTDGAGEYLNALDEHHQFVVCVPFRTALHLLHYGNFVQVLGPLSPLNDTGGSEDLLSTYSENGQGFGTAFIGSMLGHLKEDERRTPSSGIPYMTGAPDGGCVRR